MANEKKPKIGAGHLQAWLRAGLKELAQILPAFPSHGAQPVEEPGLAGNVTNHEVVRGKEGKPLARATSPDWLEEARQRAREETQERRKFKDHGIEM